MHECSFTEYILHRHIYSLLAVPLSLPSIAPRYQRLHLRPRVSVHLLLVPEFRTGTGMARAGRRYSRDGNIYRGVGYPAPEHQFEQP